MDGSAFGRERPSVVIDERRSSEGGPLPEREWGLSAWQVVVAVLAIVAGSEVVGLFF